MAKDTSNSDMMIFQLKVYEIGSSKISHRDPNALDLVKIRCDEYYQLCAEYDIIPTWAGLALALGITRQALQNWKDGVAEWTRETGVMEFINLQFSLLNSYHETGMLEGKIPAVPGIFVGKNNYGYINEDRETVVHELSTHWSAERLIEEAKNLQLK